LKLNRLSDTDLQSQCEVSKVTPKERKQLSLFGATLRQEGDREAMKAWNRTRKQNKIGIRISSHSNVPEKSHSPANKKSKTNHEVDYFNQQKQTSELHTQHEGYVVLRTQTCISGASKSEQYDNVSATFLPLLQNEIKQVLQLDNEWILSHNHTLHTSRAKPDATNSEYKDRCANLREDEMENLYDNNENSVPRAGDSLASAAQQLLSNNSLKQTPNPQFQTRIADILFRAILREQMQQISTPDKEAPASKKPKANKEKKSSTEEPFVDRRSKRSTTKASTSASNAAALQNEIHKIAKLEAMVGDVLPLPASADGLSDVHEGEGAVEDHSADSSSVDNSEVSEQLNLPPPASAQAIRSLLLSIDHCKEDLTGAMNETDDEKHDRDTNHKRKDDREEAHEVDADAATLIHGIDALLHHYSTFIHRVNITALWTSSSTMHLGVVNKRIQRGTKLFTSLLRWIRHVELPEFPSDYSRKYSLPSDIAFVTELMRWLVATWRECVKRGTKPSNNRKNKRGRGRKVKRRT